MNLHTMLKRNPVASFIIITLLLSFALMLFPVPPEAAFMTIASVLVFIPTIIALALVAIIEGRRGTGLFLRQTFGWRAPLKWYLIALAIGLLIHFGSSVLALVTGRISAIEIVTPAASLFAIFPFALLEEIGWRGFALRRLLDQYSPFVSTIIVGIPWALLHITLFVLFVPDISSPIAEGLIVFAFAFPLTWIYVKSERNLLVATVLHGAMNAFGFVAANIPPAEILWFVLASGSFLVTVLLILNWRMWFAHPANVKADRAIPSVA